MMFVLALLLAHEFYDLSCCSERDCHSVPETAVTEAPDGYHYKTFVIPYTDARIKESPDGHFHICENGVGNHIRCIYVPARVG